MSMGGGQSSNQTTTTTPWSAQQPYLQSGFGEAQKIYDQGPAQFFPGQTFVNPSGATTAGLSAEQQRASQGSDVTRNASGYASGVLGGNSGNPYAPVLGMGAGSLAQTASGANFNNPYLDQTFNQAAGAVTRNFNNDILPGISAQFGANGRAGSSLQGQVSTDAAHNVTDSLATLAANIYGGNYQQERDRQLQAGQGLTTAGTNLYNTGVNQQTATLGLAPQTAGAEYTDASKLQEVGKTQEGFAQQQLQDAINRFNFGQTNKLSSLQDYMSLIQGNYGGTSVSRGSTSSGGSSAASGIGGLLAVLSQL